MSEHRLSEIVIERPRGGRRISLKRQQGFKKQLDQLTEEASQDGLLRPYLIKPRNKSKYLSDHLGPLRRLLRSQVGQPWNQVYSQLCQRLDRSTMAGRHVLDHVWDYVERHVELIDGIPHHKSRRPYQIVTGGGYRLQLFVHPETGILCDSKDFSPVLEVEAAQPKSPSDQLKIDDLHQYRQIDGVWYLITFQAVPTTKFVFDLLHRTLVKPGFKGYYDRLYAAHKRQCNKREVKMIQARLNQVK